MATAAVSSFYKRSIGYGSIKETNQDCFLNRPNFEIRNFGVSSTPKSVQRLICSSQWKENYCKDASTISLFNLRSKRNHGRSQSMLTDQTAPLTEEEDGGSKKDEQEVSRASLIWRAIKLPMYTVALIPVSVGSAAAYWQTGVFSSGRYFMILASYVIINIWVNLSNDVYDFDTGADKTKKESVVNLFGSRSIINATAWSLLALGFLGITWLAVGARNPRSIVLLASAVFCFYLYQCPPFRMSYYGVGEPLLFLAYGPFSTIAFYLLHSTTSELPLSSTIIWSSVLVGLTTALILFCSHFHQIEGDKAAGKISPLVRLGTETGSKVVKFTVVGLYGLLLVLGFCQLLPLPSVILSAMTLPVANLAVSFVQTNHKDKTKIFMAKYFCVRLHAALGAALTLGLVAARIFSRKQLPQAIIL